MDCHADKSARNDDKTSPLSHCETSAGSRGNPKTRYEKVDSSDKAQNVSKPQKSTILARKRNPLSTKTKQVIGGRIFDEKSLLCELTQGRILGVCNRRARDTIKDLSQKANAQTNLKRF